MFLRLLLCLTVLHPPHKLRYFRKAKWDDTWITTATMIVRDEFMRAYVDLPITDDDVSICVMVCATHLISPFALETYDNVFF